MEGCTIFIIQFCLNQKGFYMKKILSYLVIAAVVVFALIQFIPFGHDHTNPPTVSEPTWVNPQARALVKEHCFQCHSNETG
jgi:hypothetical protein